MPRNSPIGIYYTGHKTPHKPANNDDLAYNGVQCFILEQGTIIMLLDMGIGMMVKWVNEIDWLDENASGNRRFNQNAHEDTPCY